MVNQFSRTEMLIGPDALKKLKNSWVAVFGIGGVGSYAVEGLARSGVGHFTLVDSDCVALTNLNRQIHALHKTIGRPKVDVMKERILEINPDVVVEVFQDFYGQESSNELIKSEYNYIIDAIDTVSSKIELIIQAKGKGIPIISSMGTGNKLYPQMLEIDDLFKTSVCPLAKVMRKELRRRGIDSLKVVYSREEPVKPLCFEDDDRAGDTGAEMSKNVVYKRQVPGSTSFVPSTAGLMIAGEVVRNLIY